MKIVVASDSFKYSLSSSEISELVEHAAQKHFSNIHVVKVSSIAGGGAKVRLMLYLKA